MGIKEKRVFISSTFDDMQTERNTLVRQVFPRLREKLLDRGIVLLDIDLRWGVIDKDVNAACKEIINECDYFICVLGDRYGTINADSGISITEEEIRLAVKRFDKKHCFFYFRNLKKLEHLSAEEQNEYNKMYDHEGSVGYNLLVSLKKSLKNEYSPFVYNAEWNGEEVKISPNFAERVEDDLSGIPEIQSSPLLDRSDLIASEFAVMEYYINRLTKGYFIGEKEELLTELISHATQIDSRNYLCLTGELGVGKSALLANLYFRLCQNPHLEITVFGHFVEASDRSADLRMILIRLCSELIQKLGLEISKPSIHATYFELLDLFQTVLDKTTQVKQQVVIILDGLDQIHPSHDSLQFRWLPKNLPPFVRLILSADSQPILESLQRQIPNLQERNVPYLNKKEQKEIIKKFLARYQKLLKDRQLDQILNKKESNRPIYLQAALEEMRTFGIYEKFDQDIQNLPGTGEALFDWILNRLNEEKYPIGQVAPLLVSGRNGFSNQELTGIICCNNSEDVNNMSERIAALEYLLRPYFIYQGKLIRITNHYLRKAIDARFLNTPEKRVNKHQEIADYLQSLPDSNHRKLSELGFHRYYAVCDKNSAKRLYDLVDDASWKGIQFTTFLSTEYIREIIRYALKIAVENGEINRIIQYLLMQISLENDLVRHFLVYFVQLAKGNVSSKEHDIQKSVSPELAYEVARLVSDPSLRRMTLALLAWIWTREKKHIQVVREILIEAASIDQLAEAGQITTLLNLSRDMYCSGIEETKYLLGCIPNGVLRRLYEQSWVKMENCNYAFVREMKQIGNNLPTVVEEDMQQLSEIVKEVRIFEGKLRRGMNLKQFIWHIYKKFGQYGVSNAFLALATEHHHSGYDLNVEALIGRGIYEEAGVSTMSVRSLIGLVERMLDYGLIQLAKEHVTRIEIILNRMEKAKNTSRKEQAMLNDLRREFEPIKGRMPDLFFLEETKVKYQHFMEQTKDEVFDQIGEIRHLLAQKKTDALPNLLSTVLQRVDNVNMTMNDRKAVLICVFFSSMVGKNDSTAEESKHRLKEMDLSLFNPNHSGGDLDGLYETILRSDVRCTGLFSLCCRLMGWNDTLIKLSEIAGELGVGKDHIDTLASELIRIETVSSDEVRKISDRVSWNLESFQVPQGLGMYFYSGVIAISGWLGLVLSLLTGIPLTKDQPELFLSTLTIPVIGLVGGLLDVVWWKVIDLKRRPEISSNPLFVNMGTNFQVIFLIFYIKSFWVGFHGSGIGNGLIICIGLTALLSFYANDKGWLFQPMNWRTVLLGTFISMVLGVSAGIVISMMWNIVGLAFLSGLLLGGALLLSLAINFLPKRIFVLRMYQRQKQQKEELPKVFKSAFSFIYSPERPHREISKLIQKAEKALSGERNFQAINLFSQIIALNQFISLEPISRSSIYLNRGFAFMKIGSPHEALSDYRKAADLNPRSFKPHHNAALVLGRDLNEFSKCKAAFDKALELYPTDVESLSSRSLAKKNLDDFLGAEEDLKTALEIMPTYVDALVNLSALYSDQRDFEKAEKCLWKVMGYAPQDAQARCMLAVILFQTGRVEKAKNVLYQDRVAKAYFRRLFPQIPL